MSNSHKIELINTLEREEVLSINDWITLLSDNTDPEVQTYAQKKARLIADSIYGKDIYIRGLIEFSNYCKNNCYYCGIQNSNQNADRYRLSKDQILYCCREGYQLGFRTFVLQSGDDPYYTDTLMLEIICQIKSEFPDCALTLSLGEKSRQTYEAFYTAGADRYLLRHETADEEHYGKLHPKSLSWSNRIKCLNTLKEIGYQTGCGFMVGSPFQTPLHLAKDMIFIHKLQPEMVGIGPFIPHKDTRFCNYTSGTLNQTLFILSLIRIMQKNVLLPATTALGTIDKNGRELGILSGANVVMPNLSPASVRSKYLLYDNKICTDEESAQCRNCLEIRINSINYNIVIDRGDWKSI